MSEELLDLVDQQDNVIGTITRSEAHSSNKVFHREVTVLIFNKTNSMLFAQRSFKKKLWPGLWDFSARGHIDAGEDPLTAIVRECKEELGVSVNPVYFGKFLDVQPHESRWIWMYYAIYNNNDFVINKEEVESLKWVNFENILQFSLDAGYSKDSIQIEYLLKGMNLVNNLVK